MKKAIIIPAIIAVIAATASVFAMTACNPSVAQSAAKIMAPAPVKRAVEVMTQKPTTAPTTAAPTTVAPTTAPATQAPTEAPKKAPVQEKKETKEAKETKKAKPAPKTDAEMVYAAAKEAVAKCTNDSMTKEQKLRAAFDYLKNNYIEGIRRGDYREMDWPVVYGKDLLIDGKGDCFSYGAAFAYMAKIIGCSDCYACNSGGHGWAEVEGKIYDPEWSRHSSNYSYFGMSYDEPCDVGYKGAIGSASWMHVAV